MTTSNPHNDSAHPIRDFVREMQEQFGKCEYKATAADGTVVQSRGWKESIAREFPQILWGVKL